MNIKQRFTLRSCIPFICMAFLFNVQLRAQKKLSLNKYHIPDSLDRFIDKNYSAENFNVEVGKYLILGGQVTSLYQHQSRLTASYDGPASIFRKGDDQVLTTITPAFFFRFWKNGEFVISPEMQLGNGIGNGKGMGAYPNALYGNPQTTPYMLRAHYRHHVFFKSSIAKEYSITIGRYVLQEMFDMNPYASDPKRDFFNFSHTMLNGWDAAVTAYGYTQGIAQTISLKNGSVSLSVNTHNLYGGGPVTDWNIYDAHSVNLQLVGYFKLFGNSGKVRLLGFYNRSHGGDFKHYDKDTLSGSAFFDNTHIYTTKFGAGIDINYNLTNNSGLFLRYSMNDGLHEDYGTTQCDGSLAGGASFGMKSIKRTSDRLGICASVNTISALHQQYLKDGGTGFMVGDGNLSYAPETVFETYYCFDFWHHAYLTLNYQYALNVGYNADRGNAHFLGLRLNLAL